LTRNNTELQSLRDEIASIGRDLQRENVKPPAQRDDEVIRDLSARLEQLTRRFEQTTAENTRLRREVAQAEEEEDEDRTPQRQNRDRSSRRSGSDSQVASASEIQPQLPAPEAGGNPLQKNGGSSVSSVAGNTLGSVPSGARRSPGSSVNNALLSGRRTEGNSDSGNAITVSEASSAEYQQLLSQTNGDQYSTTVSPDDFSRLAGGDTSILEVRFGDRLPTEEGQVRRYEILKQGSQEKVEIIVARTENGLSVTFGQGATRSIASEAAPEPEAPVSRDNTLEDLNRRIQDSR
jgi:hypothetical protein